MGIVIGQWTRIEIVEGFVVHVSLTLGKREEISRAFSEIDTSNSIESTQLVRKYLAEIVHKVEGLSKIERNPKTNEEKTVEISLLTEEVLLTMDNSLVMETWIRVLSAGDSRRDSVIPPDSPTPS